MARMGASRLFLDSNVLVSGARGPGVCRDLLEAASQGRYVAIVSWSVLEETAEVLERKFCTPARDVRQALDCMNLQVVQNPPEFLVRQAAGVLADADDAPILAAALAAKVQALVTGDAHFTTPTVQARTRVLTPREALDLVTGSGPRAESEGES